jgi:hypothetical protein
MSRITRLVVLVTALMSLFAVASSTAGAVTWHNTGNTGFTATGGPGTLSVGSSNINCTSADATGSSPVSTTTNTLATGTVRFTGCTAFFFPAHVNCNYTLTGQTQPTPTTVNGTADVHCNVQITAVGSCTITGTTQAVYTNPVDAGSPPGRLHLLHPGNLAVHNAGGCPATGAGTLTTQTLSITSVSGGTGTLGPRFTRTA